MPSVRLSAPLQAEYQELFDTIEYTGNEHLINHSAARLYANRSVYHRVGVTRHVPWVFVGIVHLMESGGNFNLHLHNGDPLTARTVHVPKGRPAKHKPPFTWEQSAVDALYRYRFDRDRPRSIPRLLWWLERYNGWGYHLYHHPSKHAAGTLSPYLWAGCQHYTRGKYGSDGEYDETLKSKQIGAAVIFRRFCAKYPEETPDWASHTRTVSLGLGGIVGSWYYQSYHRDDNRALQMALNKLEGIFLKVDSVAGPMTSEAFRKATGHYLKGDPRE